jgi:hypothetical protein
MMSDDDDIEQKPIWEPLPLRCKVCGHEWQDWQPSDVPINTWLAHIKNMHCRQCSADYKALLIVFKPVDQQT